MPPQITYRDFEGRGTCLYRKLYERVKKDDSEVSLQSSASAVTIICSAELWDKMRQREGWNSPYVDQAADRDRAEILPHAYAIARDIRDELAKRLPNR